MQKDLHLLMLKKKECVSSSTDHIFIWKLGPIGLKRSQWSLLRNLRRSDSMHPLVESQRSTNYFYSLRWKYAELFLSIILFLIDFMFISLKIDPNDSCTDSALPGYFMKDHFLLFKPAGLSFWMDMSQWDD